MRRVALITIAGIISVACIGNSAVPKPLDQQSFEMAKAKCGFADVTYFSGGFSITLAPGQERPTAEQRALLACMDRELAGFDYHVVTETPPPA